MRATILLLGLLALAPLAPALPAPLVCAGACSAEGSAAEGYVPLVLAIATGSAVTWTTLDTAHVQTETTALSGMPPCFTVGLQKAVRFDLAPGGAVIATQGAASAECDAAQPLPGGAVALPYHCALHPNMNAVLVIEP
ncbi:MAG: hypothetical protein LC663_03100 [Actinobacteria bacterium]|nr:hypothetical protein [Actinomycetota bacterium]